MLKVNETSNDVTVEDAKLISQIKGLHSEILGLFNRSVEIGIDIGGLLKDKKKCIKHGEWTKWMKENLPFTSKTATNYMNLYTYRIKLRKANVKDLQTAYKLLSKTSDYDRQERRSKARKRRKEFAHRNIDFTNPNEYENSVHCGNSHDVMQKMVNDGMEGKYAEVVTSNPYNADFDYGDFNDNKPYNDFLDEILKLFPLYPKLLRKGGRVVYITTGIVANKERETNGDYNHSFLTDLIDGVRKVAPELKLFNHIIWDKSSNKDPLNNRYGTHCDPKRPLCRSNAEHILVWSNEQFDLENIEATEPDITPEEFDEWSWSIWKVAPHARPNSMHPCSFPHKLIERVLKFYSYPNDLILDPYAGESVTAQVCKKLNRRYTMIELNPNYCEESVRLLKSA